MNDEWTAPSAAAERKTNSRPSLVVVAAALVFAEAGALAGVVLWLVAELFLERPGAWGTAVGVIVLAILAAAWLTVSGIGLLRRRRWARSSAVTWQVLQLAVAAGCFQGIFARPDLGWVLLLPAVALLVLLFLRPVVAWTR